MTIAEALRLLTDEELVRAAPAMIREPDGLVMGVHGCFCTQAFGGPGARWHEGAGRLSNAYENRTDELAEAYLMEAHRRGLYEQVGGV